jgi:hypothetical protein
MTQRKPLFDQRQPLAEILDLPKKVQSVYSLTQHVWAGSGDAERAKSKAEGRVRLDTLDEFFIDPVRNYLNRVFEHVADNDGQGFWFQAEFGVGKSHLLAATAVLAVGGAAAWEHVKKREDEERKAGPGARLDSLWRKKLEKRKLFPIIFSLEGVGGGQDKRLEDFILDEAQATFTLRTGKPLAVYPEQHLARLFLKEHQRTFEQDLRRFLADKRLMKGLPRYEYAELIKALQSAESQRDAGRVLMAFYRERNLTPQIPTERGERLARAIEDILESGHDGVFVVIDEMSEYLRRSHFGADDEDCLLTLSSTLAKARALPVWTLVAAQAAHSNPKKIIGPDRLFQELLEHKAERFRDIVVQRTRRIRDREAVTVYYQGYKPLVPWVKKIDKDDFEGCFPFPPDAIQIIRRISTKLTGTRSTISFLHTALKRAADAGCKDLVPLWQVFDDLMSYNETPSPSATGSISLRTAFRSEVAALEAAQATLKRVTDGQLARPQNRQRAERILNTLFLYHIAGVEGLTAEQVLDAVCDLKPGEDELEAQRGHYETILGEMATKLRSQIRFRADRYEFVPKQTGEYDDLAANAAVRLRDDGELLAQYVARALALGGPDLNSPFDGFIPEQDGRRLQQKIDWHGQERTGRLTAVDLRGEARLPEINTHDDEDDFLVVFARRPLGEKKLEQMLGGDPPVDPRVAVWAPGAPRDAEKATLTAVLAHLVVAEENRETAFEKEARSSFRRESARFYTLMLELYGRGNARTSRTSLDVSLVGGLEGATARMASVALDTCYRSRMMDFGSRRFDTQGAVKLINGLVKRGRAVSEGDQLWSAVENFAEPLGLVRAPAIDRLDPAGSTACRAIRERVEDRGRVGIEVRTVYNWFTGYDPKDGKESWGLTRRMVDVYLVCLAQQGAIRISDKRGTWIDRATVAGIDFKPETLRSLSRIELPRGLDDWATFCPYIEGLAGLEPGTMGSKYDKARAEEALRTCSDRWLSGETVDRMERDLRTLFEQLGRQKENPFDGLLVYWLDFYSEEMPSPFDEGEVFDTVRRAALKVAGVAAPSELTATHLAAFRANHEQLSRLRQSYERTTATLISAARLARARVPDDPAMTDIRRAQADVSGELEKAPDLVLSPDTVATRLEPALARLRDAYVPAYIRCLSDLEASQKELEGAVSEANNCVELQTLDDLGTEISEARHHADSIRHDLADVLPAIWLSPDRPEQVLRQVNEQGFVSDPQLRPLSLETLSEEGERRQAQASHLGQGAGIALSLFGDFLLSPSVRATLGSAPAPSRALRELTSASGGQEAGDFLAKLPTPDRRSLAKEIAALLQGRRAKTIRLSDFAPTRDVIWNDDDLEAIVAEFRDYLHKARDGTSYLRIERQRGRGR